MGDGTGAIEVNLHAGNVFSRYVDGLLTVVATSVHVDRLDQTPLGIVQSNLGGFVLVNVQ